MMKQFSMKVIGVGIIFGVGVLAGKMVTPLKVWGGNIKSCTLESYNGRYVFAGDGKFSAIAGVEIYNGDGTVTGIFSQSLDGTIAQEVAYTGTYTVNPDCSSTVILTETVSGAVSHYSQFLGPKGEEFTWVQTDPGSVSAGFEKRVR
jgi:hypothetical protein